MFKQYNGQHAHTVAHKHIYINSTHARTHKGIHGCTQQPGRLTKVRSTVPYYGNTESLTNRRDTQRHDSNK